ncbi:MAG: hypothetical protein H0W48_01550 [Methylibium sp.]|nr:hypothetical protein [Methylibium sp.]
MRRARLQRGIGTLALSMLLLVGASIVLFYLNRSLVFEQRSSANQLRSTMALEVAEAGLEWATGMLNRPHKMQDNCTPVLSSSTAPTFRNKYVPPHPTLPRLVPAENVFPGCTLNGTALSCHCPNVPASGEAAAALGAATWPGFTVRFTPGGDDESVRITSTGCSALAGACTDLTAGSADATATVSGTVKLSPLIRSVPATALTCGASCNIGTVTVENLDVATNGITIDAAGPITFTADHVATIAGLPPENSVLADDAALDKIVAGDPLCTGGALFKAYFGSTLAAYVNAPTTKAIACSSTSCPELVDAYGEGWRSFYLQGAGGQLSTGTLGSAADPVTLVSQGTIALSGSALVHGLVFANAATLGAGTPTVQGALLACAAFTGTGTGRITYDPVALRNVQRASAVMVRVPGTWRDFPPPTS